MGYIISQFEGPAAHKIIEHLCLNIIGGNINVYPCIMDYKERLGKVKENLQLAASLAGMYEENAK